MTGLQSELCETSGHQAAGVLVHVRDNVVVGAETYTRILGMCLKLWGTAALSICGPVTKMEFLSLGE